MGGLVEGSYRVPGERALSIAANCAYITVRLCYIPYGRSPTALRDLLEDTMAFLRAQVRTGVGGFLVFRKVGFPEGKLPQLDLRVSSYRSPQNVGSCPAVYLRGFEIAVSEFCKGSPSCPKVKSLRTLCDPPSSFQLPQSCQHPLSHSRCPPITVCSFGTART